MIFLQFISNEYLKAGGIIVATIIVARLLHLFLERKIEKLFAKSGIEIEKRLVKTIVRAFYVFLIIWGVYLSLLSLSFFSKYLSFIKGSFFVISVALFSFVLARTLSFFICFWLTVQKKFKKTPELIAKIISAIIYLIAVLIILDYFNIKITPLVASLGLGGVAVALALQSTLSNLFAGLHIISDQPVSVGDYVELEGGISGYVEDIGWRSTKIRTLANNFVVVPNSKLAESIIKNLSLPKQEMTVSVKCGVSYNSDLEKVEKITLEEAKKIQESIKGAVKDFKPFLRFHTFGESNIEFSVFLRVEKPIYKHRVIHEFIKALKKRYDKEGIEISYPIRKVYLEK